MTMARIKLKYATPRVFNIDQAKRRLNAISAAPAFFPGNILRITFDREVDVNSAAFAEDFTITLSGGPVTAISDPIVYAGQYFINLVLSRPFICGETGTVTYRRGTYRIFSVEGWQARAFTLPVTNINACTTTTTTTTEGFIDVNYGYLYNWYAATDAKNIAAAGWHVPTDTEFDTLSTYLGGNSVSGGKLKEIGTTYWSTPNTGATNEVGFNARGGGARTNLGVFSLFMTGGEFLISSLYSATDCYRIELTYSSDNYYRLETKFAVGSYIRLLKDTTTLTHGQSGTYTGNDGKVYRTICIGTQEWLADNLCETLYRDLSPIPEVTNNAAWAALVTGARCSYDNDESLAL